MYENVLKTRSYKSELLYKNYKKIFENIEKYYIILYWKRCSKKMCYSKLIIKYNENIKKHGQ